MIKLALLLVLAASAQDLRRLYNQGNALADKGDLAGAAGRWEQGLSSAKRSGDHEAVANFSKRLGWAYTELGDYPKAEGALSEAAAAFRARNLPKGEGSALSSLARLQAQLGRYDEALASLERSLALAEQARDRLGLSIALRESGNVHSYRGEYKAALGFYERSSAIAREVGDEAGQSADLTNLAITHKNMGELPQALELAQRALAFDERKGDPIAVAQDLSALGNIHFAAGRLKEAEKAHERARGLFGRAGVRDGEADALINTAGVASQRGDFARAGELLERALSVKKELGDPMGQASCLLGLSELSAQAGDLGSALRRAEEALSLSRGAEALQALGDVRRRLGDYGQAAAALSEALSLSRGGGDKAQAGRALGGLASLYIELGDWEKARASFEEALSLQRQAQARVDEAATLNNLAVALRAQGLWPEAEKTLRQALELSRELGVPALETELGLADAAAQRGDLAQALKEYERLDAPIALGRLHLRRGEARKALAAFERSHALGEGRRDPLALYAESTGEGQAWLLLGQSAKAESAFARAAALAEEQREGLDEAGRAGFFEGDVLGFRRAEAYEGLIAAAAARPDDAFERAEALKARALAEAMARARLSSQSVPPALRDREEALAAEIRALRRRAEGLFKAGEDPATVEKALAAAKARQAELVRSLRGSDPEYAAVRYPRPLRPADISLLPGEVLVEFAFAGEKAYRFVVRGGRAAVTELPAEKVRALVAAYRAGFELVSSASDLAALDLGPGRELYDLLVRGVAAQGERLIIVPDGPLGLLPFEALAASAPAKAAFGQGEHGPFPLGARYLADETEVTYAQSATTLALLRSRAPRAGQRALALVDPAFGADEPAAAAWRAMGVSGARAKGGGRQSGLPRLARTRELGSLFTNLFPGAEVLSGEKATKKAFSEVALSEVRYAVFGTHGLLGADVPYLREPALALSGGFLTMSEVTALTLPAEVVALTACQTGVGKSVSGEGVMGMGRAFQYAGAQSVLMSLWPVAEDGSVALTSAFFTALKEGAAPRAALRRARETVRRAGYEHPFYWAAFILVSR